MRIPVPAWEKAVVVKVQGTTHNEIHIMEAYDDMVEEDELVEIHDGAVEIEIAENMELATITYDYTTCIITVKYTYCW